MIDRVKEVDSFDGLLLDGAWFGEPVEGTDTGREVVERCEVRQIAAGATRPPLPPGRQAVQCAISAGGRPRRPAPLGVPLVLGGGEGRSARSPPPPRPGAPHAPHL